MVSSQLLAELSKLCCENCILLSECDAKNLYPFCEIHKIINLILSEKHGF